MPEEVRPSPESNSVAISVYSCHLALDSDSARQALVEANNEVDVVGKPY
jgi:hypothetical protein